MKFSYGLSRLLEFQAAGKNSYAEPIPALIPQGLFFDKTNESPGARSSSLVADAVYYDGTTK